MSDLKPASPTSRIARPSAACRAAGVSAAFWYLSYNELGVVNMPFVKLSAALLALGFALAPIDARKQSLRLDIAGTADNATITGRSGARSFRFSITMGRFDVSRHRVTKRGNNFLIDGHAPLGTEGGLPRREVKSMSFSFNGKPFSIPKPLYADCYELRLAADGKNDVWARCWLGYDPPRVSISCEGSDGGGGYVVTWTFHGNGKADRYIESN